MSYQQVPPEVTAALAKENRSPLIIGIVSAFTGLAFFCVVLRFFTRFKLVGMVGLEDYFIALSIIFSIFTSACLIQTARLGNGKHALNVPYENLSQLLKYLFYSIIAYHVTLTSTKLSILLQYRRIFTLQRLPIYIIMGFCLACGTTAVVTAVFTCIPVNAYWNLALKATARCVNQDAMYHANAALNMTTDLLVAALPVRQVWKLQIALKQKIALLVILTLGWFVVIISALRLYFLILVAKHPEDITWYSGPSAYWSALEYNLAIVCASTPALKPLIIRIIPMFGSRFGSSNKRSKDNSDRSHDNGFMRLKGKPSHSTMEGTLDNDVVLQTGAMALPLAAYQKPEVEHWKEIRVTRDIEQNSVNEGQGSDDSWKGLYGRGYQLRGQWAV